MNKENDVFDELIQCLDSHNIVWQEKDIVRCEDCLKAYKRIDIGLWVETKPDTTRIYKTSIQGAKKIKLKELLQQYRSIIENWNLNAHTFNFSDKKYNIDCIVNIPVANPYYTLSSKRRKVKFFIDSATIEIPHFDINYPVIHLQARIAKTNELNPVFIPPFQFIPTKSTKNDILQYIDEFEKDIKILREE